MNVQPMTLDLNMLRAPQKPSNQIASGAKEDNFSYVLDRSREKQEQPVKEKVDKSSEKDTNNKLSDEKPKVESKNPEPKKAEETKQVKDVASDDDSLAKEKMEKAMTAVAELLGITVEDLEKMLATLQMGLSDLLKGNNLQQLIMEVTGTEEPMDLLLIPELGATMKEITSVVEKYTDDITKLGFDVKLLEAKETQPEILIKPEINAHLTNQNNMAKDGPVEVTTEGVGVEREAVAETNVIHQNSEELSQNEEQSTPDQNNASHHFLDTLTQSMGEVFQSQNAQVNQVNEAFETIAARTEPVNPRMVLDQIVEKIKVSSLENEAQMNIQLKPEHLGKLSMEVVSRQGILTAHITVENEKTKEMLEQNIQSLRESLENKGLVIQALEVAVGQNKNDDRQTYEGSKTNRNVSDIINRMMNEEIIEEEIQADNQFDDTNEVDYIA